MDIEKVEITTKEFFASDAKLEEAQTFLTSELENAGASFKLITKANIVLEELFVNVAHYAYGDESGNVRIGVGSDENSFYIVLEDNGIEFDPFKKSDPDISLSAEEREIGGLGIFMTKKIMDEYEYEFRDGVNIVRLRKFYE